MMIVSSPCSTSAAGETGLIAGGAGVSALVTASALGCARRVFLLRRFRVFFFVGAVGCAGVASAGVFPTDASALALVPADSGVVFFFGRRLFRLRLATGLVWVLLAGWGFSAAGASSVGSGSSAVRVAEEASLSADLTFFLRFVALRLRVTVFFLGKAVPFRARRPICRIGEHHVPFNLDLPHAVVIGRSREG